MKPITTDKAREIVEDFARAIREKKTRGAHPEKTVINFRTDRIDGVERWIERVPLDLLRYRKDNGRIASDVLDYEKSQAPLDERDDEAQKILRKFLEDKDPEKTEILLKSMEHAGQIEPAIITCDGFLINGNRRKMVLEKLRDRYRGKEEYASMKVVILPGPDDPGGPPTLLEIERLENRYQLQSEGKSEYYGFDRALSIKRKMELGFSLEEQLRDDPRYVRATKGELDRAIKEVERDYLKPLESVDRYLEMFNREGLYHTVSEGPWDREGRWQAFIDYSNAYHRNFANAAWRIDKGIDESDVGAIEDAAFKIIRLRDLRGLPKVHKVMRDLPKLIARPEGRKEILKLADEVDISLPKEAYKDEKGEPLSVKEVDEKWAERSQRAIIHHVKKAIEYHDASSEKETPLTLLDAALKKLTHEKMKVESIALKDLPQARQLAADVQKSAKQIEGEIYHYQKELHDLGRKK
jgi:hypothetical protein